MSSDRSLDQGLSRRNLLVGSAAAASALAASSLPGPAAAAPSAMGSSPSTARGKASGSYITAKDGTQL
ncbi:alpha/beta hydrolase, partial [Cupriavidus sp. 2MCAB6]